jgi:hypothetical protein
MSEGESLNVMQDKLRKPPRGEKRVLLVASSGGHWIQLCRISSAFDANDTLYATTFKVEEAPNGDREPITIPDASRTALLRFFPLVVKLFLTFLWFRPRVVVSTGAAPGLMAIIIGKAMGATTIWLDSIANSERLSRSGRIARSFADLWLTQWEGLANSDPDLQCFGRTV